MTRIRHCEIKTYGWGPKQSSPPKVEINVGHKGGYLEVMQLRRYTTDALLPSGTENTDRSPLPESSSRRNLSLDDNE